MRFGGVAIVTLCGLLACGRDPILEKAEAEAAAKAARAEGGAPPGQAGAQPGGRAADGAGGTPGVPGGPGAPAAVVGADGQPLPGSPEEPAPGIPEEPSPGLPGSPPAAVPGSMAAVQPGAPRPGVPKEPAPGIPSEPPPGQGGGGPQGPTVAVSGEVVFAGWTRGAVRITAFDGDHASGAGSRPKVIAVAQLDRPGAFTVNVAENAGKVYFEAAVDEDGDGRPGPLDPQGKADRFPVTVGEDPVGGLEIELTRREPPPGGRGAEF